MCGDRHRGDAGEFTFPFGEIRRFTSGILFHLSCVLCVVGDFGEGKRAV